MTAATKGRPTMSWIGEFFAALPDVMVALWEFGGGFTGVILMGGSIVLIALFCLLALRLRERQGWLAALFGVMAALLSSWWLLGIIPSAWVYFVDSQSEMLADQIIPSQIIVGGLEVATNFYNVFRDTIVLVEGGIVVVGYFVLALIIQKRFPGGLAEGEERGPTTGGYK
jgi:hypothetical protein